MNHFVNESSQTKTPRRRWWVLLAVLAGFLLTGFLATVLIVHECGKGEFSAKLGEWLSRRLDAEVVLSPVRPRSLLFLDCPSFHVRDLDGRWAFQAKEVSFELLPSAILAGGLGFRSVMAREGELWLGGDPARTDEARAAHEQTAAPGPPPGSLPGWLKSRLLDLGRIPMESIEVSSMKIRGHESMPKESTFEIAGAAVGKLRDGQLDWRLVKGQFQIPGQNAWSLGEFAGEWTGSGLRVEKGLLVSPAGAVVSCRSQQGQPPGDLVLDLEAKQVKLQPSGLEVEEAVGPVSLANAAVTGVLRVRLPEVHRFHFAGDVDLEGLSLGESRIFRLLSGQTGEERLKHPGTRVLTGRLECTPGVIRLTHLNSAEKGLFRLEGWLSIVAEDVLGVFDLALPAPMVGRIPGGKPQGFSYPASGWSWARLRVEGKTDGWQEDLSQRLMAQISKNIPVKAGPCLNVVSLAGASQNDEQRQKALLAASRQREETMERLFYSLIGE